MKTFILILICFQISHFIFDFVFRTNSMIEAKKFSKPIFPIIEHAILHAFSFYLIGSMFKFPFEINFTIYLIEFVSHFLIDYFKGFINRFNSITNDVSKSMFWTLFGFDQFLHQIIIIIIM